jgi:uncharacterized protein (DUF1778 family)
MAQLTIRADEEVVDRIRSAARAEGKSVNRFVTDVLSAATDPDHAGSDAERTRERLRRAGLLDELGDPPPGLRRPDPAELAKARRAASQGTPLSDLIVAERRE